ncbi:hypothetical protein MVLG_05030 [Microbotryum lychnidis-dioicae p1A1 Lamole]|uniref:Uncharacterized protein n=1 Tax=Microbotryum lychnidis-dioicae (strain p1A1 Lamole / MvSl-1064) TaxID=683840 RepID=U5HD09_USTV1|nr:hypothetical protein MVLG_05030 [Microbotryum lychnidis-dioicae p1A1 Lamole]|eukprot:KDE04561.1 hypothetical protein MVLG_05030 [Microbotryum lychnidis-dioicae p1A1 Lamole]
MALCMVDHGRQTRSILELEDSHLETQGSVRSPSSCASSDGDDSVVFGAKRSSMTTTITTDAGPSSASVPIPTALGSVFDQGRKRSARLSRRDTVVVLPDVVAVSLLHGSSSSSPVSNRQSTTGEQRASPLRVSSPLRTASPFVLATPNKTSSPLKPTTHSLHDSRPSSPFPTAHSYANNQENSPTLPPSSPRSRPSTPSNLHLASPLRPGSPLRFATAGVGSRPGTPSGLRAFWPVQNDFPAVQDEEQLQLQRMLRVVVEEGRMALATEVGRVGSYEEEQVRALGDYDDATTYSGFFDEAHMIQNHAATQEDDEEDETLPHMPYVTMRDLQPPAAALELLHSTNSTTVQTEHIFHPPRRAIDYDDDELTDTDSPWEVDEVSFGAGSGREGEVDLQGVGLDEGMVKCFEEFGFGEEREGEAQEEAQGKEEERGLEESDELGEEEEDEMENEGNETELEAEAEQDDFDLFNPVDEAQQLVTPAEEADSPDNEEEDDVAVNHETEQEEDGEGTPETSTPSSPSPSPKDEVDTELECNDNVPEQSAERAVPVPFRPVQHPESSSTAPAEEQQDSEEETSSSDVVETPAAKSPAPSPTKTPVVPSVVKEQLAAVTAAPTTRRQLAKPREIFKPVTKASQPKSRPGGAASSAVPVPRAMLAGPSTSTQASSFATNSAVPSTSSSPASKKVALTSKKVVPVPVATARPVVARKIASPTRLVKAKVPIPSSSAALPSTRLPSAPSKPVTKQTVPRSKPILTEGTSSTIPSSHLAAANAPASPRRSPRRPSPPTDHHARSNSSASTASSSSTTAAPVAATRPRVMAAPGASATRVAAAAARRAAAASAANENMAKKPGPRPAMTTTLRTNHTIAATEGCVMGAPSATTSARQPLGRPGSRIIAGPSASNIATALVRRPASALSTASTASSVEVTVQPIVVPVAMPPAPSTPVADCPPTPALPLLPRPAPLASAAPRSPEKKAQRVKDGVVTTKQVDLEIARPPSALGTTSRGLGLAKTPSLASAGYTSPIRSKPQLLPPPLPLPRTGLFGLGPTPSSDSILTASTESLDPLASAVAAKGVFAPSAPARELLPPPLPRPTRQTRLLAEDRVAPATPVSEQPTALLPRPVRRKKPSIDTIESPLEPLTPRPVLNFQPAPVLTQDELTRLTQRNTKKNQLHFNHHQVIVTHLEVPRPPSPTSKIRKSIGEYGVSGATSVGREAKAAKRRNALRSSTDGSEVDLLNSELDATGGASATGGGVARVEQLKTTHYRAPGDEEEYSSPVRPSTSSNENKKRGSGATKKTSVGSAPARRVKWDKALVYEGPLEGQGEVKVDGILKVKAPLDSFGNLTVNNGSLGKAVPVQIKKLIYIDDPPE